MKITAPFILTSVLLLFHGSVWSQGKAPSPGFMVPDTAGRNAPVKAPKQPVPQKDLGDVYRSLFSKKHPKEKTPDSLILKPTFSGIPAVGYTYTTRLAVSLSGNMAFRTDSSTKLSTVTASAAYTENRQFTMPIESNIWTRKNAFNLLGDYRFYKYPQNTFGLGSNSDIENAEQLDYYFLRFSEVVQKHLFGDFFGGLGYMLEYQWDIDETPPKPGVVTDFDKYDSSKKTLASGFIVNALFDSRDNSINPSKGFYASVQYRNNPTSLGSQRDWQSLIIDVRKYFQIPREGKNILAFWSYNWLIIQGKPPYLDLPSTSWDVYSSTGRGYIQGRFKGAQMVYLESEYRFGITANGLLGGVVFLNGESFSAAPGTSLESMQPGFGTGLRIKLNKKSKTNLSVDYGFGTQGSGGLFINIAEMF